MIHTPSNITITTVTTTNSKTPNKKVKIVKKQQKIKKKQKKVNKLKESTKKLLEQIKKGNANINIANKLIKLNKKILKNNKIIKKEKKSIKKIKTKIKKEEASRKKIEKQIKLENVYRKPYINVPEEERNRLRKVIRNITNRPKKKKSSKTTKSKSSKKFQLQTEKKNYIAFASRNRILNSKVTKIEGGARPVKNIAGGAMAGAPINTSTRLIKNTKRRTSKKSCKSQNNIYKDIYNHLQKYINIIFPKQARKYIRIEFVIVAAILLYLNRNAIMGVRKFKR